MSNTQRAASSRRSVASFDADELSYQQAGRGSERSHSSRHTWRSGLIPPCLEPPYRIPSHFPVPQGTLSQVPGLNHPELSRGQRRYLHSTAQIYSMDSTKRALSNSYYGLLMNELLRGGGSRDSHKRYSVWIYGNHKRLFETNPAIWRSPRKSRKNSREDGELRSSEQGEKTGEDSARQAAVSARSGDRGQGDTRNPAATAPEKRPVGTKPQKAPTSPAIDCQNPQRIQSGRQRPPTASGKKSAANSDDEDADYAQQIVARPAARPRQSARGSRTSVRTAASAKGSRNSTAATAAAPAPDDEGTDEECVDNQRPRDLNKIMF